jgi:hypothetical protein
MQYIIEEIENGVVVNYSMAEKVNDFDFPNDVNNCGKVYKRYFKKLDSAIKWIKTGK